MNRIIEITGLIAGLVGMFVCFVSVVLRLAGFWALLGFDLRTVFITGIGLPSHLRSRIVMPATRRSQCPPCTTSAPNVLQQLLPPIHRVFGRPCVSFHLYTCFSPGL